VSSEAPVPSSQKSLARISITDGKAYSGAFVIENSDTPTNLKVLGPDAFEKLWLVLRDFKHEGTRGYQLAEGDVIRFGRAKLCVREISGAKTAASVNLTDLIASQDMLLTGASEEEDEDDYEKDSARLVCRICYSDNVEALNPLMTPCSCDGTMKFIHLKCLQQCLRSRINIRTTEKVVSFVWKSLDCELCKKPFPHTVTLNGQRIELIDIPKPDARFIVFELLRKDKTSFRGLHLVSLGGTDLVKIGRAHDNDMRISDISVSRLHATITIRDGSFYLQDEQGKFGTLVRVRRPIALDLSYSNSFQAGRTLLHLSQKKPWSLLPACFCSRGLPDSMTTIGVITAKSVLPISSGFSISLTNAELASSSTSRKHRNLFFAHHNIGANSSCEEDSQDEIDSEEVRQIPQSDRQLMREGARLNTSLQELHAPDSLFSVRSYDELNPDAC
jgi:hypothetical protein